MITGAAVLNFVQEGTKRSIITIGILILTILFQKIVSKLIANFFIKSSKYIKVEETRYKFFRHFVSALIYMVGIGFAIYTVPSLRTLSVSLFAGAGIIAVIIGFASQHAFANIISGIFIVIFKPFRVGDRITIGTTLRGVVEDINLRHTIIKNFENKRIIVPNSIISNEYIENASISDDKICRFVEVNVSYDSDINKALKIMEEEALKHPLHIDNRSKEEISKGDPIIRTKVITLGDSGILLRAWVWAKDSADSFTISCDLNKSIKERFDKENIEIPFPHRTIVYKKDILNKKRSSK